MDPGIVHVGSLVYWAHSVSALVCMHFWGRCSSSICSAVDLLLHLRTRQDKHLEDVKRERSCCVWSAQRDDVRKYNVFVRSKEGCFSSTLTVWTKDLASTSASQTFSCLIQKRFCSERVNLDYSHFHIVHSASATATVKERNQLEKVSS